MKARHTDERWDANKAERPPMSDACIQSGWTQLLFVTSRTNTLIYREIVQSGIDININKLVSGKYT
jgi:hypothetical protein